jgi:dehydrogenase/reductase SDR family protein 12
MPDQLSFNYQGIEFQCASQLLGHYFLFYWLHQNKKINSGARIVWVSSGGMYLKKLDLNSLFRQTDYDKVATYANVKRAQVTLVEELAKMNEFSDYNITVMHPGWVKTTGVKDALPGFFTFMNDRLRLPPEGADTIVWILLTSDKIDSGGFYFDRKKVSAYISKGFIPSEQDRKALIDEIKKIQPSF